LPATDLPLLIDAARAAGEIARRHWRADPQVWDKGAEGPVTEADLAVDRHLRGALLAARPGYGWLSEETPDDASRLAAEHAFIVDPIDGTRAFLAGETSWAHSLAISEGGSITAAVVYLPVEAKLYAAAAGQGATLNGTPLRVASAPSPDGARVLANRAALDPAHWREGLPRIDRHFRPSLAYRLALVAEGRFDAMLTFRPAWEWDIAAGALLVGEAGGAATDRRGAALRFNTPDRRLDGVVAAGHDLHGALSRRLAVP
jgi:myo-inositol-1(or 4)-monophosphatase